MNLAVHGESRDEGALALGRYRVVCQLGQGGTAQVYLAVVDGPSGFQKLVVLKVLKRSLGNDYEFRAMFLHEARLAARLLHPNIVQTNEVLDLDGMPIIVMEYLEGQPLSEVIVRGQQGGFTLAMRLRVLIDALHGLHAAHELTDFDGTSLGVVHRDVSPQNIFVTFGGHAKVLDFGIAKLDRSLVETEVGTIKGKLRYMAPEQIAGEKLDRRADLYAAGVMLWEATAGERMWKGLSEEEIKARVLAGDLPRAAAGPSVSVPASLERICRRALALLPGDRHPTALALAEELESALAEMGPAISHRRIGATVAKLFEDVRAETREAIERMLGRTGIVQAIAAETVTEQIVMKPVEIVTAPIEVKAPEIVTAPIELKVEPVPPRARRWRRYALIPALGGLAVAAAILISGPGRHDRRVAAPAAAREAHVAHVTHEVSAAQAAPAVHEAPVAHEAHVTHEASAGQAAPTAHEAPTARDAPTIARNVPPSPAAELARVPGPEADTALTPVLELRTSRETIRSARRSAKRSPAPVALTPPSPAPPPAPSTGNGPPDTAADCAHPFFVDADGIKKFRPECM